MARDQSLNFDRRYFLPKIPTPRALELAWAELGKIDSKGAGKYLRIEIEARLELWTTNNDDDRSE